MNSLRYLKHFSMLAVVGMALVIGAMPTAASADVFARGEVDMNAGPDAGMAWVIIEKDMAVNTNLNVDDFEIVISAMGLAGSDSGFEFVRGSTEGIVVEVEPGPFGVREVLQDGYTPFYGSECSGIVEEGDIFECEITNRSIVGTGGSSVPNVPNTGAGGSATLGALLVGLVSLFSLVGLQRSSLLQNA